jgi:hypothetical protein
MCRGGLKTDNDGPQPYDTGENTDDEGDDDDEKYEEGYASLTQSGYMKSFYSSEHTLTIIQKNPRTSP